MPGERLARILAELEATSARDELPKRLCEVTTEVVGVTGAGVMLMSGDVPQGSLCTTNSVSSLIEELQYTLGEGPCVDAYQLDEVVLEPNLARPQVPRWLAFSPPAVEAGVRGVFGFPLRVGSARLGALNLYQDKPGELSTGKHADALVMAQVIAHWVLDNQASASPEALERLLESGADFHFVVNNAAGMVSVQAGVSITEALIRLRAAAFSENRLVRDVALDVVNRRRRFSGEGPEPAISGPII
jgi:GAF domain-containing protein